MEVMVALLVNVCVDIVDVVGRVVDGVLMVSGCVDVVDVVTCGCDRCGRQLCGCGGCEHESGGGGGSSAQWSDKRWSDEIWITMKISPLSSMFWVFTRFV